MTKDQVTATMHDLAEMGYIEPTGELRPDSEGRLKPVYRITALGQIADHYLRQGLNFESAMARAKVAN